MKLPSLSTWQRRALAVAVVLLIVYITAFL